MKKFSNIFNNLKFEKKLICILALIAIVPLLLYWFLVNQITYKTGIEIATQNTNQIVDNISGTMELYIGSMEKMMDMIDEEVSYYIWSEELWNENQKQTEQLLEGIKKSHSEINGIAVITQFDDFIGEGLERVSEEPFCKESWYQKASANKNGITLINHVTGRNIESTMQNADKVFSIVKPVVNTNNELLGMVLFDVKDDIITKSIENVKIGQNGFVYILDETQEIVYTPTNDIVYRISDKWFKESLNNPIIIEIREDEYQIISNAISYSDWSVTGVFYLNETVAATQRNNVIYIVLMVITISLIAAFAIYFSKIVTDPLKKLTRLMKQAEKGDLGVRFNRKYNDEIGELGVSFDKMLEQINELIQLVVKEQNSKRKAELESLQAQIKPHFLYNTLDTISWLAKKHEATDVVDLVDALANMFRIGISQGNSYITIADEIKHISNYLYIQKTRYGEEMDYNIHISEHLSGCYVPKLIIQPLVENAIYHGIKLIREQGYIDISVTERDGEIIIEVRDNGAGLPQEKIDEMNARLQNKNLEKSSFGIFYVQDKIRLSYGENYNVSLRANSEGGITSAMNIPMMHQPVEE